MSVRAERLESRLCLTATLADGVLTVTGTGTPDVIRVVRQGDQTVVRETTGATSFPTAGVARIVVNAGEGDDRIRLDRVTVPTVVNAGGGNDRVNGGRADDTLFGGDGDDRLSGGNGDDEIRGDAGNDWIAGDLGDDDLAGGDGSDRTDGGPGTDTADVALDSFAGIENFPGLPAGFIPDTGTGRRFGGGGGGERIVARRPQQGFEFGDPTGTRFELWPVLSDGGGFTSQQPGFAFGDPTGTRFELWPDGSPGGVVVPVSGPATVGNRTDLPGFAEFPSGITFPGFVAFPIAGGNGFVSSPVVPVNTTGLDARGPGLSTISPLLSSQPSGNTIVFDTQSGLFVRAGSAEIPLRPVQGTVFARGQGGGGFAARGETVNGWRNRDAGADD